MVHPGQQIQQVEEEQFVIVDLWQSYVSPLVNLYVTVNVFPGFLAGSGKSILWYAVFQ